MARFLFLIFHPFSFELNFFSTGVSLYYSRQLLLLEYSSFYTLFISSQNLDDQVSCQFWKKCSKPFSHFQKLLIENPILRERSRRQSGKMGTISIRFLFIGGNILYCLFLTYEKIVNFDLKRKSENFSCKTLKKFWFRLLLDWDGQSQFFADLPYKHQVRHTLRPSRNLDSDN